MLGPIEVRHGGQTLAVGSGRERFVLATLLLNSGRLTSAERLIDALWENEPPRSARAQLHNMISNLRHRLNAAAEGLILTRPAGYELHLNGHRLDLAEFRRLVRNGRQASMAGNHAQAVSMLDEALALWSGAALADVPTELAGDARETLHEEKIAAAESRLDAQLTLGSYDDMLRALTGLTSEYPYRERLYEMQMLALTLSGRRADALNAYRLVHRRLVDDLGIEPGAELRDLEQKVLRDEVTGPTHPPAGLPIPRQLPPATTLIGRNEQIGEITGLLRRPDGAVPRVAILVGPGGVGKTALAVAAAHDLRDAFPDGQLYADLRGTRENPADSHAVLGGFLRAFGVDGPKLPEDHDERIVMYRSTVADRRLLIVLDDAAGEAQVRPLLPGAPGCGIVITSRRNLGALIGVGRWAVPVLAPSDALALLSRIPGHERLATDPDSAAAITELCGRLPLAVCIAAARLTVRPEWTLEEYRTRLADEHQRLNELAVGDLDVRASISLSYHVLNPRQRRLLRRLGLIAAPDWPTWVAEELLGEPIEQLLDQLADVHLVEPLGHDSVGQCRYRLHDLIADFARERAHSDDNPTVRDQARERMLSGWLALASDADERVEHGLYHTSGLVAPPLPSGAAPSARRVPRDWFEAERVSLTAAVNLACRLGQADLGGRLALRLSRFLELHNHYDDWERTLCAATTCVREQGCTHLLIPLLLALEALYEHRGKHTQRHTVATEALAMARRLGDREWEIRALSQLGRAARALGRFSKARDWLEQAVDSSDRGVPGWLRRRALTSLATLHAQTGDPARALPMFEEALATERELGKSAQVAIYQYSYALVLTDVGRLTVAERMLVEALDINREIGDEVAEAYFEQARADLDIRRGQWQEAADRLDRSYAAHAKYGSRDGLAETLRSQGDLAAAQRRWADAVPMWRQALDIWRRLGTPLEMVRTLARLERAHRATGDEAAAAESHEECSALLAALELDDTCLRLPLYFTN